MPQLSNRSRQRDPDLLIGAREKAEKSKSLACTKTEVDSHNCENNIATILNLIIFLKY